MADYGLYNARVGAFGTNDRDRIVNETKDIIIRNLMSHPSLRDVKIGSVIEKIDSNLVIISTSDPNVKQILSLPNEKFSMGQCVEFSGEQWLINKADVDDEMYVDGQMTLCPNILKFQNSQGNILSYPYFVENPLPSLDVNKMITTSSSTRKIKLPFDELTREFFIDKRFMGEMIGGKPQCWKVVDTDVESERGLMILTQEKDEFNKDTDKLGVCNYFEAQIPPETPIETEYCKITYSGKPEVKCGGSFKSFDGKFYDSNGSELTNIVATWELTIPFGFENCVINEVIDNIVRIKVLDINSNVIGKKLSLKLSGANDTIDILEINVVSLI